MNSGKARRLPDVIPSRFSSIRVKLTVWYGAVLAIVLIVFSVGIYLLLATLVSIDVNNLAQSYRRTLTTLAAESPTRIKTLSRSTPMLGQLSFEYVGKNSLVTYRYGADRGWPVDQQLEMMEFTQKEGCKQPDGSLLVCTYLVRSRAKPHNVIGAVAMSASLNSILHSQYRLRTALLLGVPVSLLIALIGGWALASRALAPVEDLRRTAQAITATDLRRRIGLTRNDELGRLAQTLDDMIERLDTAFREQRQLTADVSHELRTPLSVIQAQTSLALKRERTPEEYAAVLDSIQEETDRMSRIVSDLLMLARAEAGQETLEHDPVRLDVIARWAVDHIHSRAQHKGVEVKLLAHPVMVEGDSDRLRQLSLNLVDNAVKYTDPGGRITVKVAVKAGAAQLEIADTGVGIDAESLPHIFQRFYRADWARARGEGSGLGLAIVQWIVDAHGGTVTVRSKPGEGSVFTVKLPLHTIQREEPPTRGIRSKKDRDSVPAGWT